MLDPDVIVLGGGMSNVEEIYRRVPERWGGYVFSDAVLTKLVQNRWGDSSGVRGAAWLVRSLGLEFAQTLLVDHHSPLTTTL